MNILLVDDDHDSRKSIQRFLEKIGHQVVACDNGQRALEVYQTLEFPMVVTDINMPKKNGIELLKAIKSLPGNEGTEVILFTGYGDMKTAIEALRLGAYDYLIKPLNIEELAIITERIAKHQFLVRENKLLTQRFDEQIKIVTAEKEEELARIKKSLAKQLGLQNVGFFSPSMQRIFSLAQKYHTDRSIPVLIQGETGSGKEIIAKTIHYWDMVDLSPFVDINCAALTASLFESEFFGYESGSFTGGLTQGQKGKLDLAKGGTLFLDEVGELPLELQGKLLRVIQEKEYYRVGGLQKIQTDVRIICATNVDLEKRVQEGKFRKDLFYRLKVGHLVIPELRERREDILPLAQMFLRDFSKEKGKQFQAISKEAERLLLAYEWPGNVRELRNVMEWAVFMYDEKQIQPEHLNLITGTKEPRVQNQKEIQTPLDPMNVVLPERPFSLDNLVNQIVWKVLEKQEGNKTDAARFLGISRKSLYTLLRRIEKSE